MKFLSVVILIVAASCVRSHHEVDKEKALAAANECKEETGATDDDVAAMFKHEAAVSTEAKCLRSCVMKKFDIMNEEGKIVKEGAINLIKHMAKGDAEKEQAGIEIVESCIDTPVSDDHCEAAVEFLACMKKVAEEKGVQLED